MKSLRKRENMTSYAENLLHKGPGKNALPHESSQRSALRQAQGPEKLSEAVFCIPHRRDNAFFSEFLR